MVTSVQSFPEMILAPYQLSTDCITASSMTMFKNRIDISQEGGLHVDEHYWTLIKPMASLTTCHLALWLGWLILLNRVKSYIEYELMGTLTLFII